VELFPFLTFTVIFCCLVVLVAPQGDRASRVIPVTLIVLEVLDRGVADAPVSSRDRVRSVLSFVVALGAMVQFLRPGDRALTLLAFFASLQQFLVAVGVIEGVDL